MPHFERHRIRRIGWLRAAVLGANDGIVSTASLVLGVAATGASSKSILIAGEAGTWRGWILLLTNYNKTIDTSCLVLLY